MELDGKCRMKLGTLSDEDVVVFRAGESIELRMTPENLNQSWAYNLRYDWFWRKI